MKVSVFAIGKSDPLLIGAVEYYQEMAQHYWKIEVQEFNSGVSNWKGAPPSEVAKKECEGIMSKLPKEANVIALERLGKEMDSVALSEYLQDCALMSVQHIIFVIGGAYGMSKELLERADQVITMSPFTFTHGFARLILLEQLYRAGTIMRNEPYHKGTL
ncbi:MAG: 23S rRNA (pseudouridine(1915)-N(3))-methyltransferase RlmH [Gemmatimonadetes bacterium]|nr:23S rRNA (pseudouridine(1915)-N(3))-methyltransferase RlmH [Gemmatimonadota bacterium]|tara:strand:- start:772 stop:1251 length:480 start_codon:yes stop_codon:yes gene_type:complete